MHQWTPYTRWLLLCSSLVPTVCKWIKTTCANCHTLDGNPFFFFFTKINNNYYDWLLAKMFHRSADAQVHTFSVVCLIYYLHANCPRTLKYAFAVSNSDIH